MLFGTQRVNPQGHLEVGGVDTVDLAREFGTPLYVMDEEALRERCREYHQALEQAAPGAVVSFATKAFLCGAAARLAVEEGLHLDVASIGEQRTALAAGVDPQLLTLHGNFKTNDDLNAALDDDIGLVAIDGVDEMRRLSDLAAARGRKQRSVIRVAPGVDAHTLDAISTGRNDTKFGITAENGAAVAAIEECAGLPGIELIGIHAHVGSQICSLEPFQLLAGKMMEICAKVHASTQWTPELIILGGGLGIHYTTGDAPPSIKDVAAIQAVTVAEHAARFGIACPRIGVEPGRSTVGEFGLTLYTVGPVKDVPAEEGGTRTYVTVDGGMSDNPRPLLYGARYPVLLADRANAPSEGTVRLTGRHCETDTLFDAELPRPQSGDLLAVLATGAYNHVMASNYNAFYRPPVVFVREGNAHLVVRRETQEDLMARDVFISA
jgi:diaminopimelate decarboxylase